MPKYTACVAIVFFASLGLPGFSAFIGEAFVIIGAFNAQTISTGIPRWMAIAGSAGIFLSAAYFLWTLQRMFFGQTRLQGGTEWQAALTDLNRRELIILVPAISLALILGIMPSLVFGKLNASILKLIDIINPYL